MKDDGNDPFKQKIKKILKDENLALNFIMCLLGENGIFLEFIMHNNKIEDMPLIIKYACFMSATQLRSFINQTDEDIKFLDKSDYMMSEQTEERIYRIMNEIIDQFVEIRKAEVENGR